jgi:hypothetical protein
MTVKSLHLLHVALLFASSCVSAAPAAEPLDLAVLTNSKPIAAKACEPLDLRILTSPVSITARPVEALDLAILSESQSAKPTRSSVKPAVKQSAASKMIELGKEVGDQCRPLSAVDLDYPDRLNNWTFPGKSREELVNHLLTAKKHAGKYTPHILNKLSLPDLLALHSDDHEDREKPLQVSVNTPKSSATDRLADSVTGDEPFVPSPNPVVINGQWHWQHRDKRYWNCPEPGVSYTWGQVSGATAQKPASQQPVYQSGGCPGGVCPTNRVSGFRLFRRG